MGSAARTSDLSRLSNYRWKLCCLTCTVRHLPVTLTSVSLGQSDMYIEVGDDCALQVGSWLMPMKSTRTSDLSRLSNYRWKLCCLTCTVRHLPVTLTSVSLVQSDMYIEVGDDCALQ